MSDQKALAGFDQIGLASVLRQYRLKVPPHQREYSWENEHVTRLFQDIARAMSNEKSESDYFLGTIVTIPRAGNLLEVVDGQQRLATTAILLAEIRDYLRDRENLISESITNDFLTDIDRERRQRVTKLQLNTIDNEYFREMLSRTPGAKAPIPTKASHLLIEDTFRESAKHIKRTLQSFDPKDHGDILNKLIRYLEHSAVVILLRVPSDRNAYKMFETLNDRGLRTSQWDLVKSYLFGESDTPQNSRLQEAQDKWAVMRGVLDSLEEEDSNILFLRHALIAIRGHVKRDDVYDAVQNQARGPETSLAFLSTLETLASQYVAMFNPENEKWNTYPDEIRRAIKTLNLFNLKPFRPLMLSVALRFSEKEATQMFTSLISWGVRLLIAGSTRSGSVEEPLAEAAKQVFNREISDASTLKKKLAGIIPGDQQFRLAFEVATVSKPSLARYYLRSLERRAKGSGTPWFIPNEDKDIINLEHILPQKPSPAWDKWFDKETARADVNRLGNQALLLAKQNSDLRSSDFAQKVAVYADAPYELTSQIATVAEWKHEQIVDRQKVLAGLALSTWPL